MPTENLCKRLALGAVAGGVATLVLQIVRTIDQKLLPETEPPIKGDPGKFMLQKTERLLPEQTRQKIPQKAKAAAAKLLGFGYGMSFGALYSATRPEGGRPFVEGPGLGIGSWAAGFLGWLPATGLMPPVWKHQPKQIVRPLAEHALFGVTAVAAYDWLRKYI